MRKKVKIFDIVLGIIMLVITFIAVIRYIIFILILSAEELMWEQMK